MAETGGHAGSQGAGAGCPSRGLCSQAGPERKGGVHPEGPGRGCRLPQDRAPWGSSEGSRALSCWLRVSSWVLRPTRQAQGPAWAAGPGHQGQAPPWPFRCPENVSLKDEVTSDGTHNPQAGPTTGAPNKKSRRDGESGLHGRESREAQRPVTPPRGPWHMQPPPGGPSKVGEAASEKAPGSEKGPDRTTASGWAHGGSGCPAGRAEGGAHGASGEGEATRTVAEQALFPSLAETQTPLPSLPESCGVSCRGCAWSATEFSPVPRSLALTGPSRAWGLWRPIQASCGRPAPQGV